MCQDFQSKLTASDFVVVNVPQNGRSADRPNLYVAELTSSEEEVQGLGRGAWGRYLVKCGRSWKRHETDNAFFLPLSDIIEVLDDYTMEQTGRSIVFTFQNI